MQSSTCLPCILFMFYTFGLQNEYWLWLITTYHYIYHSLSYHTICLLLWGKNCCRNWHALCCNPVIGTFQNHETRWRAATDEIILVTRMDRHSVNGEAVSQTEKAGGTHSNSTFTAEAPDNTESYLHILTRLHSLSFLAQQSFRHLLSPFLCATHHDQQFESPPRTAT